ncbi:hypothetical protein D0T08_02860 [Emticicia sp. C21]|nr:hypothetical protein D0T08_02860 [Emticicia sp. C21]
MTSFRKFIFEGMRHYITRKHYIYTTLTILFNFYENSLFYQAFFEAISMAFYFPVYTIEATCSLPHPLLILMLFM